MRCLVVHAHPLPTSLTRHFCDVARQHLAEAGHQIEFLDLYAAGFDPRLTQAERATHHAAVHDHSAVEAETAQLQRAEIIVLIFPTWWFGPPAIVKGWIDRVFAPGVAFAQGENFGPIKPLLAGLKKAVVVTTLGSPWWVDWLVIRRPMRRVFKTGVFGACAPHASFYFLPFYDAEKATSERVARFCGRIKSRLPGQS